MEWWPCPNLPVYVVCPRDGEGCSQTLHRNYLLPISSNLGHVEDENSVVGVKTIEKPIPVPPADNGLPADGLTKSQPESLLNLLPEQHEPVDPESTGSAAIDLVNEEPQAGQDQPTPLRQRTHMTRNQLP